MREAMGSCLLGAAADAPHSHHNAVVRPVMSLSSQLTRPFAGDEV